MYVASYPNGAMSPCGDCWSAEQNDIAMWHEFKKALKARFIGRLDGDDLMDSLRRRTQAKGESISGFLTAFKLKLKSFGRPPDEQTHLEIIYKNLSTCRLGTLPILRNMDTNSKY